MTIFRKSLLTLGLSALGFSSVIVIAALVFMNSLYYKTIESGLGNTAHTLVTVIGEERIADFFVSDDAAQGNELLLPFVSGDAAGTSFRITLIDPKGNVLWDSHITENLVNHIDREEITAALNGKEGTARRKSISMGLMHIYYALPVRGNDHAITGVFRLSFIVPVFWKRISSILPFFLVLAGFLTIAAFLVIYSFTSSLSYSFERLADIIKSGASLLPDPEFKESGVMEFSSLEKAMRAMTRELHFRFQQAKADGSRLEAILNGMSEAVFAMDSALMLHLINPRARELFKLGDRSIDNVSLLEATHSTELEAAAQKTLFEGRPVETELVFHGSNERFFQVYASPLPEDNGGVVMVLEEITKLVKLERIRKDFVANVSHELRTPIQLIKGFSETLQDMLGGKDRDMEQAAHYLDIIRKNAGTMENLTNDLLVLSGLENDNKNTHQMEVHDVSLLLAEAVSFTIAQAQSRQTEIIVECPQGLRVTLCGLLISQAIINLIDNAIKYCEKKSKIWVKAYQENNELVLEVRDNGPGIPAEHLDRIFERFYRVDRSRSFGDNQARGTGLGLSIVRHIALLHGGKTEAESHFGQGSLFRLRLPI